MIYPADITKLQLENAALRMELQAQEHATEKALKSRIKTVIREVSDTDSSDTMITRLSSDNERLYDENILLKAQVKRQKDTIAWLRNQLYSNVDTVLEPVERPNDAIRIGRPKAMLAGEKTAARKLRKAGWTIREISEKMGYSIGLIQKEVASVKVDEQTMKEHRKERNQPQK